MSERIAKAIADMRDEVAGIMALVRVVEEIGEPEGWKLDFSMYEEQAARWMEVGVSAPARPLWVSLDQSGDVAVGHVWDNASVQRTQALWLMRDKVADALARARKEVTVAAMLDVSD